MGDLAGSSDQVAVDQGLLQKLFFKYNRRLLGELCRSALRSLIRYFEVSTGSELMPGVIAAIQTFGDRINLHPHLHFLVTEGGVERPASSTRSPESTTPVWPHSSLARSLDFWSKESF